MYRILSFLLFIIPICLQAQIYNLQGDIYSTNGDIVSGKIQYYIDQPGDVILFDSTETKKIYHLDDIAQILLENGKKFTTKNYIDDKGTQFLLFQSIIESPKISLYGREEGNALAMYVSKDYNLIRLENNASTVKVDDKDKVDVSRYKKYDYQYVGVLSSLMADRQDLVTKMSKIKLSEKDVTDVILNYNKGEVTYFQKSDSKYYLKPDWMLFVEYGNICSYFSDYATEPSFDFAAGFQYYFKKSKRNSIKTSLEYTSVKYENQHQTFVGIGFRYQFDFYKSRAIDVYGMFHVMDLSYMTSTDVNTNEVTKGIRLVPRFSPGVGMDVMIIKRFFVYGEINSLFQFDCLPRNFSFGFKYDIGKNN